MMGSAMCPLVLVKASFVHVRCATQRSILSARHYEQPQGRQPFEGVNDVYTRLRGCCLPRLGFLPRALSPDYAEQFQQAYTLIVSLFHGNSNTRRV